MAIRVFWLTLLRVLPVVFAILLFSGPASAQSIGPVMRVAVDATDANRAIFRVRQSIPVSAPGPLTLRYPQWLPGNHSPRGEVDKLAGLTINAAGRPVTWRRATGDPFAFMVDVPAGIATLDVTFDYLSPTDALAGRVSVSPAISLVRWSQLSLYPAGRAVADIPVLASVRIPADWTLATALPGGVLREGATEFAQTDYATLIDSPVMAGRHSASHDLGSGVRLAVFADNPAQLAATPDMIAAHQRMVGEAQALFGPLPKTPYMFLLAISDILAPLGLEHAASSENVVASGYFSGWDSGPGRRQLLGHELSHVWNGKRRLPASLVQRDYATAIDPELLWVYEGLSQYYGVILAARSGLWSGEQAREVIALAAADMRGQSGRRWRPLADTVHEPAIVTYFRRDWADWQRGQDYYNEALLIWLEVDQRIRRDSNNARSLDDFTRAFFGTANVGPAGPMTYAREDVIAALNRIQPGDWAGFFSQRIDRIAPEPPIEGLALGGYELVFTNRPNSAMLARDVRVSSRDYGFGIGIEVGQRGGVGSVRWEGPGFRAGLTPADRIVEIDGATFSQKRLEAAILRSERDRKPIVLTVARHGRSRQVTLDWTGGLAFPQLRRTVSDNGIDRLLEPLVRRR